MRKGAQMTRQPNSPCKFIMIFYRLIQNMNDNMVAAFKKWYARPVMTGTVDLDYIAERIQRNSTAKKSDAKAVLTEMVEVITDCLQNSQRVKIDGFGCFKVGISSKGSETEDKYSTGEHIRGLRIIFQPEVTTDASSHKRIKKMLQGAQLVNIKNITPKGAEEDSGDDGDDSGNEGGENNG